MSEKYAREWQNPGRGRRLTDSPFMPSLAAPTNLPNTPGAITRYQRFHGLPQTGTLNTVTATHMRKTNTFIAGPRS